MANDRFIVQQIIRVVVITLLVFGMEVGLQIDGVIAKESPVSKTFNHNKTAFPLTGQHRMVPCESCHLGGQYESLSSECSTCHEIPRNHVVNKAVAARMGGCPTCHAATGWRFVNFVHPPDPAGSQCQKCHDGRKAPGKPSGHIVTTAPCDTCHKMTAWTPATFAHDAATVGKCSTCHTKPSGHVSTTASCDTCHKTTGWIPATFTHDATAVGKCSNCHTKPSGHVSTTAQCDTCHATTGWIPVTFTHDATAIGKCSTCHTKPSGHVATTSQCDVCHRTSAWVPISMTTHDNPKLIGGHIGVTCATCHSTSFDSAFYRDGIQYGFCSNCHRRDYKYPGPGDHKNAGATLDASLQKNANCANCHRHASYKW